MKNNRIAQIDRKTKETKISGQINLDGIGNAEISTGVGFLDHMLEQLARHSLIDISVKTDGDLHIDQHHTVEDTGIALGEAIKAALGDKLGVRRYGHAYVPMDETLSRVALDFSGRPYLIWHVKLQIGFLGEMDTQLFREFFQGFSQASGLTLHCENLYGENDHHVIESIFKATAKALKMAVEIDPRAEGMLPSTKGTL